MDITILHPRVYDDRILSIVNESLTELTYLGR